MQLLGAADAFAALVADRPYRACRSPDEAATVLRDEAAAGRFDRDVVECVVAVATGAARPATPLGGTLTEREEQVLRLVTQGSATRQIARTMGISPKTADTHIQQIYAKTGRRTRAGVTLFAMEHGLVWRRRGRVASRSRGERVGRATDARSKPACSLR